MHWLTRNIEPSREKSDLQHLPDYMVQIFHGLFQTHSVMPYTEYQEELSRLGSCELLQASSSSRLGLERVQRKMEIEKRRKGSIKIPKS